MLGIVKIKNQISVNESLIAFPFFFGFFFLKVFWHISMKKKDYDIF